MKNVKTNQMNARRCNSEGAGVKMTSWLNNNFRLLALTLWAVLSSSVWGEEKKWDFSTDNLSSKSPITLTYGQGSASNNTTITSNTLRLFANRSAGKGSWIKFEASTGYEITAVSVTGSDNQSYARYGVDAENTGDALTNSFSFSNKVATVSSLHATSFAIKNGQNSGSNNKTIAIASITITYASTSSKTLSSIAVTIQPTKKNYTTCETLDLTGCVVTATYSDNSTENVTSQCTFNPANGAALTTSVTSVAVSYEGEAATISDISVTEGASDTYVDNVHGLTPSGDFSCSYKAPSLKDRTKGETSSCEDTHYHFVGWVEDGVDPQTNPVISAGTDMTGSNATYKAVWAAEK